MVKRHTIKHTKTTRYSPSNIIVTFLEISNTIKLFHWKTKQYSIHKATDDLYGAIQTHMDTFVEQLMGTLDSRIKMTTKTISLHDCDSVESFKIHILNFKKYLENLNLPTKYSDLYTIRDELLGEVNKFLYLYSLH